MSSFRYRRTAVWKVIKQLQEEGYQSGSGTKQRVSPLFSSGYSLPGGDRQSDRYCLGRTRTCIILQRQIPPIFSAKQTGRSAGAPHGTLVAAGQQSAGKGRRGRTWESPADQNIYMSLLLRPTKILPVKAPMLTLVMAYAAAMAIRECTGLDVQIKWPNDLVINGKKICGILTEMSTEIDYINYVVIGIGINTNAEQSFQEELQDRPHHFADGN